MLATRRVFRSVKSGNFRQFFNQSNSTTMKKKNVGTFGLKELQEAPDFIRLSAQAISRVNSLRGEISSSLGSQYPSETLLVLDRISNEICSVIDVAEFCRHVHSDANYREAAEASFYQLSSFIHSLNSDSSLYNKLCEIVNSEEIMNTLNDEERIFAIDLKKEFETDGIHLSEEERSKVAELQGEVMNYETAIMQTLASSHSFDNKDNVFTIDCHPSENIGNIKSYLGQWTQQPSNLDSIVCPVSTNIGSFLLNRVPSPTFRKQVWQHTRNAPTENVMNIGGLINARHKLAKQLGFPSYTHKALRSPNAVLSTPEAVNKFLTDTSIAVGPIGANQLSKLDDIKLQFQNHGTGGTGSTGSELMPWDIPFYSNQYKTLLSREHAMRNGSYSPGSNNNSALSQLPGYLTLSSCLEGMTSLVWSLFGIKMKRQLLQKGESWVQGADDEHHTNSTLGANEKGIYKYELFENDTLLGTVYLDLFQRPNKVQSCAHFTLRCGCSNAVNWSTNTSDTTSTQDDYQTPIVALVFNLNRTPTKIGENADVSMSLHELEILFHEWGHALHSLLSRTTFQHLSGTRGALDFVEVPSHLMEYFARDSGLLHNWAINTPSGLIDQALSEHTSLSGIDMQTQLMYSVADQAVFNDQVDICDTQYDAFRRAEDRVSKSQKEFTHLPLDHDGNSMLQLTNHAHITTYGGCYYSYVYARMYAHQIFDKHFASALSCNNNNVEREEQLRTGGTAIWQRMLKYGASKNHLAILEDVGGKLDASIYIKKFLI